MTGLVKGGETEGKGAEGGRGERKRIEQKWSVV